ncbi:YiiX/YebB-like N1pC/P60 family cysteine hydrolase [Flavobacterium sp. JP2137]|uniref:YiiX/YebB-like N1pC/P60 family cysteine hydrolase n=1 Tax=Flavobacterium sp. JP2137 TaxID=3414510 RepID=UPI003D2FB4B0
MIQKLQLFALYILLSTPCFSQEKLVLQSGDLIFQNLQCGPMCDAINEVTTGYKNLKFNHIGLVVLKEDQAFVIEAGGQSVKSTPLQQFLSYSSQTMYLGRVKEAYTSLIPEAIAFATEQIGLPYDDDFLYDNGKYYCSELIYDAFKYAYKKPFFKLYPMTYKPLGSADYFPVWVSYFEALGQPIPEGLPGCNPGGISTSDKINILGAL